MYTNRRIIGWPVSEEVCKREARKYRVNTNSTIYLSRLRWLFRSKGCDLSFARVQKSLAKEDEHDFILTIHEGYTHDVDIQRILSSLPPSFEKIKEDFEIDGPPRLLIANDGRSE